MRLRFTFTSCLAVAFVLVGVMGLLPAFGKVFKAGQGALPGQGGTAQLSGITLKDPDERPLPPILGYRKKSSQTDTSQTSSQP
jgi:hypothetical protein